MFMGFLFSCQPDANKLTPPEEIGVIPAAILEAQVTWTLDYDQQAQEQGLETCSYSRSFHATQFVDMNYLCPECDMLFQGQADIISGFDCYQQFNAQATTQRIEQWGWNNDIFYRSTREQSPMSELTLLEQVAEEQPISLEWSADYETSDGAGLTISAAGEMSYYIDDSLLLPEAFPERTVPYVCGWPQNDPQNLSLTYQLGIGQTFPNVRLQDQCQDKLALWDLYGHWLIIDSTQPDCGPCQVMAATADAWLENMRSRGYPIMLVSLLGKSLAESNLSPSDQMHSAWVAEFALQDPVLQDKGFANALFPNFIEDLTGMPYGFPAWVVVDPTFTIVDAGTGFSSWDTIEQIILSHQ